MYNISIQNFDNPIISGFSTETEDDKILKITSDLKDKLFSDWIHCNEAGKQPEVCYNISGKSAYKICDLVEKQMNEGKIKEEYRQKTKKIIFHYGWDNQLGKLQEECGELWGAVHEVVKDGETRENFDHLIEELADVAIMELQIILFGKLGDEVREKMKEKINRQIKRIEEEKQ